MPAEPHPATAAVLRHFSYLHLDGDTRDVSARVSRLAFELAEMLPEDPEKTAGLRKLLEAKDCFVRAAIPYR